MVSSNTYVALFYGAIVLLLILNRKKFDIQNKIIALYRTKIGLKLMQRIGTKHAELVKLIGYMGIGVGFVGMIFILYTLTQNLIHLFTTPEAISGVSLIIPGVKIPGSPITPPLIIGWIALFFVVVVHEFSHGVVSIAHKVKVKSSGIVFFGPLMGAFVEPDEKELHKRHVTAQYSVFAAGPWSNVLLALVAMAALSWLIIPGVGLLTTPTGFTVETVMPDLPAAEAGLPANALVTGVNGHTTTSAQEFVIELQRVRPGDAVTVTANGEELSLTAAEHPEDPTKPYVGISGFQNEVVHKYPGTLSTIVIGFLQLLRELFAWIGLLSLGIGLANLLPLGPVDGGRMTLTAMEQMKGTTKGRAAWAKISAFALLLLLLNIFWPAIQWVGNLL